MLRLEELILLENTKLSFKLQHNLLPPKLHNMLVSDSKRKSLGKKHHYETRTKNIPKLPSAQTKQYHSSFLFQSIKDYENISLEIRDSGTSYNYTLKMKKKLLSF